MNKDLRKLSKSDKIQELARYYAAELSEDPQDGTKFDCAVYDTLKDLREAFECGGDHMEIPVLVNYMLDKVKTGDLVLYFNFPGDYHWGLFERIVYDDNKPVMVLNGLCDKDFPIFSNGKLVDSVPVNKMFFPMAGDNFWFTFGEKARKLLIKLRSEGKEVTPQKRNPTEFT